MGRSRRVAVVPCVASLVSGIGLYLSHTTTRRYFLDETREGLIKLAAVLARSLGGDALRGLDPLDQGTERFQAEKDKLRRFRAAVPEARVAYVYRATTQPGLMELVMDAMEPGEPLALGSMGTQDTYDALSSGAPEMVTGLQRPAADLELTADESGVWLSAYAPIYAKDGTAVGAFGLDIPASRIEQRQAQLFALLLLCNLASVAVIVTPVLMAPCRARRKVPAVAVGASQRERQAPAPDAAAA